MQHALTLAMVMAVMAQAPPLRFNAVPQLPLEDIIQLEQRAAEAGGRPWLVFAAPHLVSWSTEVYLWPDRSVAELRRGRFTSFFTEAPWRLAPGDRQSWRAWDVRDYAQVAIPGRSFDDVRGEGDLNRPFWVSGEFGDDDLIALARFIRSGPTAVDRNSVRGGEWPIVQISKTCVDAGPDACVRLRINGSEWQSADLSRRGAGWDVTRVRHWIE